MISGAFFKIRVLRKIGRLESEPSRIAVIISKKFSNHAVVRNLARRRIIAATAERLRNTHGFDIVVLPNRRMIEVKFADLAAEFEKCLKQLL